MLLHLYDVEFVQIVNPFTTSKIEKEKEKEHTQNSYIQHSTSTPCRFSFYSNIYFQDLLMLNSGVLKVMSFNRLDAL